MRHPKLSFVSPAQYHTASYYANVGYLLGPCPGTSFLFSLPLTAFSRRGVPLCTGISSLKEMTDYQVGHSG